MRRYEHTTHGIEPVFDQNSRVLILGSLPSVKSREMGFYYGNPRNRFWPVLAAIAHEPEPIGIADRRRFLLKHRIALWDVVSSCDIVGSSDSSIRNVVPNDIAPFLEQGIERIFANGQTARALYDKHLLPLTGMTIEALPSTSPANAAWTLDRLATVWREVFP